MTETLACAVGEVSLRSPVMTASGTAGLGDELAAYGDLADLGAVVTKSLARFPWDGNPAPRVASEGATMLNAVGLAGPGVATWRADHLPRLRARGATVVASIWGRRVGDYADAAEDLLGADVAAVEVNASCPNLEGRTGIFAHSAEMTADIVRASAACQRPLWVKLSPNTPDLLTIAAAAIEAGASALVLTNTLLGMAIDVGTGRPILGNVGGGVSGEGLRPVALRAVYECRAAFGDIPIVGVGGISRGEHVVEMLMAGADAVEIGTATFANPRACWRVQKELTTWLRRHNETIASVRGRAHG